MALVYLGLGSNLDDRVGYIQQAVCLLGGANNVKIVSTSSFYETEPWHIKTEHWFVNAVIAISTSLYPYQLLNLCNSIESKLGRSRESESGYCDRTIDVDILFYDDRIINDCENGKNLTIPHPKIHERAFMLVPMLEIAPCYVHPVFKKTISDLYDEIDDPETVCLYGTRIV